MTKRTEERDFNEVVADLDVRNSGSKRGRADYVVMVTNAEVSIVCSGIEALKAELAEAKARLALADACAETLAYAVNLGHLQQEEPTYGWATIALEAWRKGPDQTREEI